MDSYQGYKDFVVSYEVDEEKNEINVEYADGSTLTTINSEHNVEEMETKLLNQHNTIKEKEFPTWERELNDAKKYLVPYAMIMGAGIAMKAYIGALSSLYFIGLNGRTIYNLNRPVTRIRLTDYCLENASSIKLAETKPITDLKLSKAGQEAFEKDHGFTLNHAHLYTTKDLKELKKMINK